MTWGLNPRKNKPGFLLIGPHEEEFLADLKETIHPRDRKWREYPIKAWLIFPAGEAAARRLLSRWNPSTPPPSDEDSLRRRCRGLAPCDEDLERVLIELALEVLADDGLDAALSAACELAEAT